MICLHPLVPCARSVGFSRPVSLLIGTPWWRCPSTRRRIARHTIKLPYSPFNRVTECISTEDDEQKRRVPTSNFLSRFLPSRQSRPITIHITCSTFVRAYVGVSLGENYVQSKVLGFVKSNWFNWSSGFSSSDVENLLRIYQEYFKRNYFDLSSGNAI